MTLKEKQLMKALESNQYLAIRWRDNIVTGLNCSIAKIGARKFEIDETESRIIGFYPISFHEYIRIKTPYMS